MLLIVHTPKNSTKQIRTYSDDAVEAVKVAKKLYKSSSIKSAGVVHQSGLPIFWRSKINRKNWVGA